MKVFTLSLVVLLLVATFAQAAKVRRGGGETPAAAVKDSKASDSEEATKPVNSESDSETKEKEVHKRGISHYGGTLASAASLWPKTYAAHYGYGLPAATTATGFATHPLTATHLHAAPALKYHGHGFHYKALASPAAYPPAVAGLSSAWPTYASFSPTVSHAHAAIPAQPFIIRPGGAVVQSYSVTYPHRKPNAVAAVKPIHGFASVAPVHHIPAISAVPAAVQPVHSYQTVQAVHHVQPVQPVVPSVPVAIPHLPPVAPPPPPVQTVVQTSFIPPAPAAIPALPQAPAVPTFPHSPDFPTTIPAIPVIPPQPSVPDVPAVPSIPTIPSIPNFPQPQVPSNSFFPVSVQPPLNQEPPTFASVNPSAQFPGFGPIAGSSPDFGSANASPQIPVHPTNRPEHHLPLPEPEGAQTPWKPVLYEPPSVESPVERPSHTLLPPYGNNSPAEGYLPPAPAAHSDRIQQEYTIDSSLFDNLSDADIQQIFAQASLAAHRDHHHHTVHNYHTRY